MKISSNVNSSLELPFRNAIVDVLTCVTLCQTVHLAAIEGRHLRLRLLTLHAGAAPAQKKWGGKEIKLMARRYT